MLTGSGKCTLDDVILGLLTPDEGSLLVDGTPLSSSTSQAWRANVSHVPQTVFLADASIAENVAFGAPKDEIDLQLVQRACQQAQLTETVQQLPNGYATMVGERGVRLSGGQRQRIGIARALYKRSSLLVLDEATSALDGETEGGVMRAIEGLVGVTVLIVAHRLSTLENCDFICELNCGRLRIVPSYRDLVSGGKTALS